MSRHIMLALCLILLLSPELPGAQRQKPDPFMEFIHGLSQRIPTAPGAGYRPITEEELQDWPPVFSALRSGSYDSVRTLAAKYNYTFYQLKDPRSGMSVDILEERPPVRRGWGTFIHNRRYAKRLYIDVNHPVDDPRVLEIGAELFRKSQAEWLLIAGAGRRAGREAFSADPARNRMTLFQRWHELITDLTHVSLSLHAYEKRSYRMPVSATDVVLSNGRTSDVQWGISELSLALRDTMRNAGFPTALAMYDSGFAPLSGSSNPQAIFSNDSVGFGHWINVELSNAVRSDAGKYAQVVEAIDRAMEITGKKISKQINMAFGLVSPRVLRIDPKHPLQFPPSSGDTYRIISFNSSSRSADTIDVRMGNWFGLSGTGKTLTTITRIDPSEGSFAQRLRNSSTGDQHPASSSPLPEDQTADPSALADAEQNVAEPMQVHRIPIQPYMSPALVSGLSIRAALYSWNGIIGESFLSMPEGYGIAADGGVARREEPGSFLIPILGNPDGGGKAKYIGVRMTSLLVDEIARIVTERREHEKDVRLLAEESTDGEYYLRIFPTSTADQAGRMSGQLAFIRP